MIDYGTESNTNAQAESNDTATLYIAFEGFKEDVQAQWARALDICRRYDGRQGSREESAQFWNTRHAPESDTSATFWRAAIRPRRGAEHHRFA